MNISKEYSLHYLYRHVGKDKNEIFYFGIGTANLGSKKETSFFRRAYDKGKNDRNQIWHAIVAKTDFEVEIVFCSPDILEVEKKEIEFIAMYGRISEGTGTLANILEGGKTSKKERKRRKSTIREDGVITRKKVYVYKSDGSFYNEFPSQRNCASEMGLDYKKIWCVVNNIKEYKTYHGFKFFSEYQGENIGALLIGSQNKRRSVEIYDKNMNFLRTISSVKGVSEDLNVTEKKVNYYLRSRGIMPEGYFLRYEN